MRTANPFEGMAATVRADKARQFFVSREIARKVIEACPDAQWRLLFALSRYGGLRCPSEHLALRWSDVDWERNRIRVPSPKTEHHEGKDCRLIPLFPELRPHLLEVFEQAEPGTDFVITRYRGGACNLRTHFCRIIRKAGLQPWPKPWHNLRSTRQTELAERYPIHVVCAWIGNSRAVAQEHYLQVTDAHFSQAVEPCHKKWQPAHPARFGTESGGKCR
ncbi:MAG TPA: tyrosine-type recombinase/integrase [Tepidisphaeraceae bacterium]|nr:tyrosine-type recombinase/integrase [Tepidisphaeraceae bacterium]